MAARGSVLLYNFNDKVRTDKVKFIFVLMGVRIKNVQKEDYLQPIGALAASGQVERTQDVMEGEGFSEEMLVLCNVTEAQLDRALAYFGKEGIRIPLKAVMTPANQNWNSMELHDELVREHEEMQNYLAKEKDK